MNFNIARLTFTKYRNVCKSHKKFQQDITMSVNEKRDTSAYFLDSQFRQYSFVWDGMLNQVKLRNARLVFTSESKTQKHSPSSKIITTCIFMLQFLTEKEC